MKNFKMSQQILLSFAVIVAILTANGLNSMRSLSRIESNLERMTKHILAEVQHLSQLKNAFVDNVQSASIGAQKGIVSWSDSIEKIKQARDVKVKIWDPMSSGDHDAEELAMIKNIDVKMMAADTAIEKLQTIMKNKDVKALENFNNNTLYQVLTPAADGLAVLMDYTVKEADGLYASAMAEYNQNFMLVMLAIFLSIVLSSVLGYWIYKSIANPVNELLDRMHTMQNHCITNLKNGINSMAKGNLTVNVVPQTQPIEIKRHDELGEVSEAFNKMLEDIQEVLVGYNDSRKKISGAINKITKMAHTLNDSSDILASSANHASLAVNEIATGNEKLALSATEAQEIMEKLSESIAVVDDGSKSQGVVVGTADKAIQEMITDIQNVANSSRNSESGMDIFNLDEENVSIQDVRMLVSDSAAKVRELDEKGQQIGKIVNVIEQIAGQTNLLALNAAIEAARAGEQGKGFAVVAEEVRHLAEQSANATKDIAALIQGVRDTVTTTVSSIETTDSSVQNVAKRVNQVREKAEMVLRNMNDVKMAAEQNESACLTMNEGSGQVSESIISVAAISEQTSASAEELSATGQELSDSAENLKRLSTELEETVVFFNSEKDAA